MASASFPTYKWWETDDKTKRLYTELLAEKLAIPRKTGNSLTRKPSNSKDIGARYTSSPKHETATEVKDPKLKPKIGQEQQGIKDEAEADKPGKYTFETITMDTLAKYDYIKSPRKRVAPQAASSIDSNNQVGDFSSGNSNAEVREKLLTTLPSPDAKDASNYGKATLSNGHFLMSQKFNSARSDFKAFKHEDAEKLKSKDGGSAEKRDKPSKAKLEEIPEYTASESSESSADETTLINRESEKARKSKEEADNKKTDKKDEPLKIEELSTKFQLLCEEVEKLEFKMYEFSDDFLRLKQAMGVKGSTAEKEGAKEKVEQATEKKDIHGITRQPSFTFADKFNSKAMLMKQQSSPRKMLAKPSALFQAKLPLDAVNREAAMAELKKNDALNETVTNIKEQEFSDEEILEILKCAKAKYIDKPNYLEELGYARKND